MTTDADYRAEMDACSTEDRECAAALAARVIDIVKAFGSIKGRVDAAGHGDGFDIALLNRLTRQGPMRARDLAEQLAFDPSTVSRQVAGLVRRGLLARQADPTDGRASLLAPTEAGLARVAQWAELRGALFAPLIADWPAADRAHFLRLLGLFADSLADHIEPIKDVASGLIAEGALTRSSA